MQRWQCPIYNGTLGTLIWSKLWKIHGKSKLIPRFKKFVKIRLESKLSLGLIYGLSFRIQAASYFPPSWIQKTDLIFYLVDFHGRNWRIPSFYENKTQPLKSTKDGFIFIGPNSLSRAENLESITWHKLSSELGQKSDLKCRFKEIRLNVASCSH